ncbi:MAG: class I SAM-dependent methyltransferase [Nitrospirae bacterium]|nr:class I SAM-dependent methyltransferase [Nitrospirota bacterium]
MDSTFYNKKWKQWDDMIKYSPAPRHRRRIVINLINQYYKNRDSLYDIGCGNCFMLIEINKKYKDISLNGCDLADQVIEKNKEQYSNISFDVMDISSEINLTNQYDIITCCEVLEHVSDINKALENLYNLLKPSGIAIITVPCGKIYPIDKSVGHLRHFTELSMFEKLFKIKQIIKWGFPFFNLYNWAINLKPEAALYNISSCKYSMSQKIISNIIYLLFFFNLNIWGSQLFIVLQRIKNET